MPILNAINTGKNTVELSFDDRSALKLRKGDFDAFPICEGAYVDLDEYEGRICARQFADAYEAALSMLDYAALAESQIRRKLKFKGYLDNACDAVIEKLKCTRLVNDTALAERLVEHESAGKRGVYAIKRRLRAKGISEDDAENALNGIDDESQAQAAKDAAKSLMRRYEGLQAREAKAKLSMALARRGFRWDDISAAVSDVFKDDDY